jgi:hypothetical protein
VGRRRTDRSGARSEADAAEHLLDAAVCAPTLPMTLCASGESSEA